VLEWRERTISGALLGPRIYTAGPIIDGDPPVWPESVAIATPEQARNIVAEQKKAGFDFLKVYNYLSVECYDALTQEAMTEGIPVVGHVPTKVGLDHVLAAGQRCIEHLDGYETWMIPDDKQPTQRKDFSLLFDWLLFDEDKLSAIVRKTRESNTWNCPTLVVYQKWVSPEDAKVLLERDEFRYVEPTVLEYHMPGSNYLEDFTPEMYEAAAAGDAPRKRLTRALYDGGARILLGTDCGNPLVVPGFSLHEELQNLVDAGLTPYQAIRTGTHDAAEFFNALDEFGTLAIGRRADLILVNANPLDDVTRLADRFGVMVRGQWYPQSVLQTSLDTLVIEYANARADASHRSPSGD